MPRQCLLVSSVCRQRDFKHAYIVPGLPCIDRCQLKNIIFKILFLDIVLYENYHFYCYRAKLSKEKFKTKKRSLLSSWGEGKRPESSHCPAYLWGRAHFSGLTKLQLPIARGHLRAGKGRVGLSVGTRRQELLKPQSQGHLGL